jgi:hypothetical protein
MMINEQWTTSNVRRPIQGFMCLLITVSFT